MKAKTTRVLLGLSFCFFLFSCGGGGSNSTGVSGDSGLTLYDDSNSSNVDVISLTQGEPGTATIISADPYAVAARPPGTPPPNGASADGTMNSFYIPSKAFDGNYSSWWVGSSGIGQWDLYYGFTSTKHIDQISLNFYNTSYVPTSIVLKTSTDGIAWTTVGTMPAANANPYINVNADIRYFWIQMDGNPASGYPLVREVKWLLDLSSTGAAGGPGYDDFKYDTSKAFDGNDNTAWVGAKNAGQWDLYYRFASPQTIQMFTVKLFNANYRPTTMKLYTSNDGSNWTDIGGLGVGDTPMVYVGADVSYLHLEMTGNPATTFPYIKDVSYTFPIGASSDDSLNSFYKPANAFDGNLSTWWTGAQGQTGWDLFYQFASDTFLTSADIAFFADTHAPANITLFASLDGSNWTSLNTAAGAAAVSLSANANTRYLWFVMTGAPSVGYPLVKDITLNTQACSVVCNTNSDCYDADPYTADFCYMPGTCQSTCLNRSEKTVEGGEAHTCSIRPGGGIKCWGFNVSGQLGTGSPGFPPGPVSVVNISDARSISLGDNHSCATLISGTARCWGENQLAQLGDGTQATAYGPVSVSGLDSTPGIISGGQHHTCALHGNGVVKCWGGNYEGQLGMGNTNVYPTPTAVPGIASGISVSAGFYNTCAVLNDGTVKCWGDNTYGQLGNGTTTDSLSPVTVSGISNAIEVAVGEKHACALLSDATIKCWGENASGQLGNGSFTNSSTPVVVSSISTAVSLSAGNNHTCVLLPTNTIKCWGDNGAGELGNGTTTSSNVPVSVIGISNALSIGSGTGHTCANLSDGTVKCWGWNVADQLGVSGCGAYSATPVTVQGL